MTGSTQSTESPPIPEGPHDAAVAESPLVARLKERILRDGPVNVAEFMRAALTDEEAGYYTTRDPLGVAGDFTTSPEISQMFGELIGLWCVDTWQSMGSPEAFALVELGPGRGTLMADALRAMRQVPACRNAVAAHLVETSPVLRDIQQSTLSGMNVSWHTDLPELGRTPAIYIANEFLDALPVHQYVRRDGQWFERVVAYDETHERFCFALDRTSRPPSGDLVQDLTGAADGDTFEYAPEVRAAVFEIAHRVARHGGAALIVDYGHTRRATGTTLQAVRRHRPVDPLDNPGECDLTAHVDFQLVHETAESAGARVHGPADQGAFLQRLGIVQRSGQLLKHANVVQAHDIRAALNRLVSPAEMGTLFKVMALSHPDIPQLAGLPAES